MDQRARGQQREEVAKVIAIDGPSGSGKSTVAKKVAQALGILYVDTGAMFRALAYAFDQRGMSPQEVIARESEALHFLQSLKIEYYPEKHVLISIDGHDLTHAIRLHHISGLASEYSKIPMVRTFLLNYQRTLARKKFCVMEGRDIGTVVFPNAFCKVFLTASLDTRAERRLHELEAKGQKGLDFQTVREDLRLRDESDVGRPVAPLMQASDAVPVDTTALGPQEVLDSIIAIARREAGTRGLSWD